MKKYHLYHRVSKLVQSEDGQGIQRQEQGCEIWITDYNKRLLDDGKQPFSKGLVYEDHGKSAYTAENFKRGQLGTLMKDIGKGTIAKGDLIVIELIDRFSRADVDFVRKKFQSILDSGVKIAITKWNIVFEEKMDGIAGVSARMLLEIGMYLAHQESSQKSARIKATRVLLEDSGKKSIAKPPFWLARNPDLKSYTVIEENADLVRKIFNLKLNYNYGPQRIIKHIGDVNIYRYKFDDEGNLIKTTQNSSLSESTVNALIRNPNVIGMLKGKNYYPRIIDDKTYYAVQRRTGENKGGANDVFKNVFLGVGKCGCDIKNISESGCISFNKCGYTMAYSSRKVKNPVKGMYLRCNNKSKKNKCTAKNIDYYKAQQKVYKVLKSIKFDESKSVDIAHLEEKIHNLDKEISRVRELMAQYTDDFEWERQYKVKRDERKKIENEIINSKSMISSKISSLDLDFNVEKDRVLFNQILKDNRVTVYFKESGMDIKVGSLNNIGIRVGYEEGDIEVDDVLENLSKGSFKAIEIVDKKRKRFWFSSMFDD
ncbi:TPA: recombinase family protein [Vibrio vulnificus]|nr:recombinase family protein [Vibrio parahaemolyticus]HDY7522228.1 recombinase family protein [Vibrio vulnificus]